MKKRVLSLALASVLMVSLFAGCGPKEPAPSGGGDAPASDKTVVYWSMWESSEAQGQALKAAVDAFTADTGIKVDLQFKGRTGIREGLQPALDAGQVIDLFDEDIDRVNTTFAPYLFDLEELSKKYDYEKTANPGLIQACRDAAGGSLKTIPYQPNVFNFFYNKGLFEAAGITAEPKTWAEFLDVCQKLKDSGVIPITCDDAYMTSMVGYHLARLVGEEGVRSIVTDGKWDDPAVAQFAKEYGELASKGYFSPNIAGNAFPAGQNTELATGKAAMYLDGSWMPNEVYGVAGDTIDWGCFAYPTLENGVNGAETANFGAQVFAINAKTEVADEAFQLIQYFTKGEHDANLSKLSIGIPADSANTEWPSLLKNVQPVMAALTTRWSWAAGVESNNDMTAIIKENALKLCGGSITADEFVANMQKAAG
ncbi:MAG: ABC transporter substrate-binding protein [Oscillospiraceae bacterium]